MVNVNLAVILSLVLLNTTYANVVDMSITPTPSEDGVINWKTDMVIQCSWEVPDGRTPTPDLFVDGDSLWVHEQYEGMINANDPSTRVYANDEKESGRLTVTFKEVTGADSHEFRCNVERFGASDLFTLSVLEPPSVSVSNLVLDSDFTSISVSFDATENADKYVVGLQSVGASEWSPEETITTTTHQFTGLQPATQYNVRVLPGNDAGFHPDVLHTEASITTKDNRPPQAVDSLEATSAGYNLTDVTIVWSLESNTNANLIITAIEVEVEQEAEDGTTTPVSKETVGGGATEYSTTLPGVGKFVFYVKTVNEYSDGVDGLVREVSHEVKPTTEPPTVPPTEPPTEPKEPVPQLQCSAPAVVVDDSGDETGDDETGDDETVPEAGDDEASTADPNENGGEVPATKRRRRDTGYSVSKTVNEDEPFTIACYLTEGATIGADQIVWSYTDGDDTVDETGMASSGISFGSDTTSRQMTIASTTMEHAGTYTCMLGNESCSTSLIVESKVVSDDDKKNSSSTLSSSVVLLLLPLLLLIK